MEVRDWVERIRMEGNRRGAFYFNEKENLTETVKTNQALIPETEIRKFYFFRKNHKIRDSRFLEETITPIETETVVFKAYFSRKNGLF